MSFTESFFKLFHRFSSAVGMKSARCYFIRVMISRPSFKTQTTAGSKMLFDKSIALDQSFISLCSTVAGSLITCSKTFTLPSPNYVLYTHEVVNQ